MIFDANKLIGIPFKLNRRDFKGCDCRGIVWLYFKYLKGTEYPFSDGGAVWFRDKRKDFKRMTAVLRTFTKPVNYDSLQEGDIVLLKTKKNIGAMGVCINNRQVLHMDKFVGSCLTKLHYIKDLFLCGFRPI